jgi:hypothetical protein
MATDTTTEKKADPRQVQLRRVRLSFTNSLFEKEATVENGTPKYGCNMILVTGEKDFDGNKAKVQSAIKAAGEQAWKNPDAFQAIAEDNPKRVCFRKGERFRNQEGEVYKGYEGNLAITAGTPAKGQKRPKLLDRHKREVEEKDILEVFYGGAYADVILSFYGTDKGGRGIFATIEAIRSQQEGERIGGGARVSADDFDDLEDNGIDAPAGGAAGDDMLG